MLNFALCDDNQAFLSSLGATLSKLFVKNDFDAKVSFMSTNPFELLEHVRNDSVDVIFLDIQFKTVINGLDIANKIRETHKDLYIIFTTGHLEYGLLSFQAKPFDYLPKPIVSDRLESTLIRLFDDIENSSGHFISLNNKTFIRENNIYYIKRDGMKLIFQTCSNVYETYGSFSKILPTLHDNFVRCHKSYIVNINNISSIEMNRNTILFLGNSKCYIGPKYKSSFLEAINCVNERKNLVC